MSTLERLVQLDKTIRDCEHSLLVAERLKERGRWKAQYDAELEQTRAKLADAHRERNWFDAAIRRYSDTLTHENHPDQNAPAMEI